MCEYFPALLALAGDIRYGVVDNQKSVFTNIIILNLKRL